MAINCSQRCGEILGRCRADTAWHGLFAVGLQIMMTGLWRKGLPVMVARKYCPVVVCVVEFRTMLYAGFRTTANDFRPPSSCKA